MLLMEEIVCYKKFMTEKNFSYDEFSKITPISRETYQHLEAYVDLLKKWQSKINLISSKTLSSVWQRHVVDSAQVIGHINQNDSVIDLGSGAGLPGLILSILGVKNVTLVESDGRKVAFLREAARAAGVNVTLHNQRVEEVNLNGFDVITARAFAPLKALLAMVSQTIKATHKMVLLKGKSYLSEIEEALHEWTFDYQIHPSVTDAEGVILTLQNIKKRG